MMSASNIIISLDNIGPALAVALLTPFYGYFIKIVTNVIVYRMDYNKLIEELKKNSIFITQIYVSYSKNNNSPFVKL